MKELEKRIEELEKQNRNLLEIIIEIIYWLDPITQAWIIGRLKDKL